MGGYHVMEWQER